MISSSFPIDTGTILVADASVIINLNATGRAYDIIQAHKGSVVVTGQAFAELVAWAHNGHSDDKKVQALIDCGVVKIVDLGETGNLVYSSLVDGTALNTLDDSEAATIGYAYETGAIAMIDERKARTICEKDFPGLAIVSTIDLLTHEVIATALGEEGQLNSIVNALRNARMRIPSHQVEEIVALIGYETAASCTILPREVHQGNK
jgi:predicted nucleic acid-binding protein